MICSWNDPLQVEVLPESLKEDILCKHTVLSADGIQELGVDEHLEEPPVVFCTSLAGTHQRSNLAQDGGKDDVLLADAVTDDHAQPLGQRGRNAAGGDGDLDG